MIILFANITSSFNSLMFFFFTIFNYMSIFITFEATYLTFVFVRKLWSAKLR